VRKIRINIFDDDPTNLRLFQAIMSSRNYEVHAFDRATLCPIYSARTGAVCGKLKPCADIIITDNQMPGMSGIDMLQAQSQQGCMIDIRNKAVASADLDYNQRKIVEGLGCAVFNKPFRLNELITWLDDCESRIDLSMPLGIIRKSERYPAQIGMVFATDADEMFHEGTAMNYSVGGLCLKTDTFLAEGQSIVIKSDFPNCFGRAAVRWVNKTAGGFCLAGLSCLAGS